MNDNLRMKYIIFLLLSIFSIHASYSQIDFKNDLEFEISQNCGFFGDHKYKYQNDTFSVIEIKYKPQVTENKRIYYLTFSDQQIKIIDSLIRLMDIEKLDTFYKSYSANIDGTHSTIWIRYNDTTKNIDLDNCVLEDINYLVHYLNMLLPKNKRIISFDSKEIEKIKINR